MINKNKVPKFGQKESKKWCSMVMCCSWLIIFMWSAFLVYCWQSGLVDKKKLAEIVTEVDMAFNRSDPNLRQRPPPVPLGGTKPVRGNTIVNQVDPAHDGEMHVVFSTDCSEYQDWQTLLLFHSAKVVGQKGRITRIASGCSDEKQTQLTDLYSKLYPEYGAHFTPDFKKDAKTNKKYDFYNKPWGMKHWLENANPSIPENTIIALLDPDMVFVRPLTPQIKGDISLLYDKAIKEPIIDTISLGHPVAQTYGLGAPWTNDNHKKFNRGKVCQEGSPCLKVTQRFGELHYSVGPPYIAHRTDFIRLVNTWTTFVPRVYEDYPFLLAEMYAYSMAAAHDELPHLQVDNYMVSSSDAGGEAWPHIDRLPQVCIPPDENGIFYPGEPMTTVVHFCQNYRAGELGFQKRRVPHNIFSCESPLLVDTPPDLAQSTYKIKGGERLAIKNARDVKRHAFVLCVVYSSLNAALIDYKQRMCAGNPATNYAKTININKL